MTETPCPSGGVAGGFLYVFPRYLQEVSVFLFLATHKFWGRIARKRPCGGGRELVVADVLSLVLYPLFLSDEAVLSERS